jgi:hypothetical protein
MAQAGDFLALNAYPISLTFQSGVKRRARTDREWQFERFQNVSCCYHVPHR